MSHPPATTTRKKCENTLFACCKDDICLRLHDPRLSNRTKQWLRNVCLHAGSMDTFGSCWRSSIFEMSHPRVRRFRPTDTRVRRTGWVKIVSNRNCTVDLNQNKQYSPGYPLSCKFQNWSQKFMGFSIDAFFALNVWQKFYGRLKTLW